jgi:hypothetical protein
MRRARSCSRRPVRRAGRPRAALPRYPAAGPLRRRGGRGAETGHFSRRVGQEVWIRGLAWEVQLSPDDGVPTACVLKPEWIRSVERSSLGPRIAGFPEQRWDEVQRAVLYVLGLSSV